MGDIEERLKKVEDYISQQKLEKLLKEKGLETDWSFQDRVYRKILSKDGTVIKTWYQSLGLLGSVGHTPSDSELYDWIIGNETLIDNFNPPKPKKKK